MAKIQCNYFDKNLQPMKNLGNIDVSRRDYAHALLSLHSEFGSGIKTFLKFIKYYFDASDHFYFPFSENLIFKPSRDDVYDGLKRTESEIFGAAVTVIVAEKKYGHRHVFPLSPEQVVSTNGKRPDFIATNGVDYSLFESKGSFHSKTEDKKGYAKRAIEQLIGVSSVLLDAHRVISTFKEKVAVVTSLTASNEVVCDIYDPENKKGIQLYCEISKKLEDYYSFVRKIIDYSDGKIEHKKAQGKTISFTTFTFSSISIEIGLLDELYANNIENYERVNDTIKKIKNNQIHSCLYGDGVYLKIKGENVRNPHNYSR